MQAYVNKCQRKLQEYIEDAEEWASAKENAAFDQMTDWALLCEVSQKACSNNEDACSYRQAANDIFNRNSDTVSRTELAAAIRAILVH